MKTTDQRRGRPERQRTGFALWDPAKQRAVASDGGKAAHQKGTAHEWTVEEARWAGQKGGLATGKRKRTARETAAPVK